MSKFTISAYCVLQRGQIFQIAEVYASIEPPLFKLKNLLGKVEPGYFYKEQLTLTDKPKQSDYFFVEKVLRKRKIRGQVFYLCKWLYYPSSFNSYVKEADLIDRSVK